MTEDAQDARPGLYDVLQTCESFQNEGDMTSRERCQALLWEYQASEAIEKDDVSNPCNAVILAMQLACLFITLRRHIIFLWSSHGSYFLETLSSQHSHGETKRAWYVSEAVSKSAISR